MNELFSHAPTSFDCLEKIRKALPSYISEKRLHHTYSVEKEALVLSEILFEPLGIDKKYYTDISAAALLHDITKCLSDDEQKMLCKKFGIDFDQRNANSAVLHSKTAAYIAKEAFDINEYVFGAIFCHTTGKENMNIFEKIIFISDYIEQTRTQKACVQARNYFYSNIQKAKDPIKTLDLTIIMSLNSTLSYLEKSGQSIDSQTIKARDFLLAEYALQRSIQE